MKRITPVKPVYGDMEDKLAAKGQAIQVTYWAWNTNTNTYQTGDAANHTVRLLKDGTEAAATNAIAEVDATNMPGLYAIALTSAEATFNTVDVAGKSSTTNVVLIGKTYLFDNVPVFAPGTNQGIITAGSGFGQLTTFSGAVSSNVTQWLQVAPNVLQAGLVQASVLSGTVASVTGSVASVTSGVNVTQWLGTTPLALQGSGLVQVAALSGTVASVTGSVASVTSGINVTQWLGTTPLALQGSGLVQVAALSGVVASVTGSVASVTSGVNTTQIGGVVTVTSSAMLGANVVTFAGNPTGVTNIDRSTRSIALGTTSNGSTTTSVTISTVSPSMTTASQFVGRIINFDANTTTANLRGQSSNITAGFTSSGGSLTVTALTDAPAFGDTWSIT